MKNFTLDKRLANILHKRLFLVLLLFATSLHPLSSQQKVASEYQLKAAFIYNFTHFINWPSMAFSSPSAAFVIGIIGQDPFGNYIDEIVKGETVDGRLIVINRVKTANEARNCHIVFINTKDSKSAKQIISALGNRNILTVSDAQNFVENGGIIGFFKEGNKVRLEINTGAAKAAQLNISSKLLSLAKIFDSGAN